MRSPPAGRNVTHLPISGGAILPVSGKHFASITDPTKEVAGRGLRSMASTLLNEQGWDRDAIERQLSHAERNSVRADYNYAAFLPERKRMMQAWTDYLAAIASGAKIIQMRTIAG